MYSLNNILEHLLVQHFFLKDSDLVLLFFDVQYDRDSNACII